MKMIVGSLLFLLVTTLAFPQSRFKIETSDIDHFWEAVDHLQSAHNEADSIQTIKALYFDRATKYFKKFAKAKHFTPQELVANLQAYPQFWKSVRPLTLKAKTSQAEIEALYHKFEQVIPNFRPPTICFAIGCIRSGGTTSKGLLMIGTEIAAADSTVVKTELTPWQKSVLGHNQIIAYVAHETVHTQQRGIPWGEFFKLAKHRSLSLLNLAIVEGSADFITQNFIGININAHLIRYAEPRQCVLWKEFEQDHRTKPYDHSKWIYNGTSSRNRPADLGYYLGMKISEQYFKSQSDKTKALSTLLHRGKYKKVFNESKYAEVACQN
ncbi:MAG: DUF2268 domain-containing putative Zn-dependent protease [Spirosomataceae bacterium]